LFKCPDVGCSRNYIRICSEKWNIVGMPLEFHSVNLNLRPIKGLWELSIEVLIWIGVPGRCGGLLKSRCIVSLQHSKIPQIPGYPEMNFFDSFWDWSEAVGKRRKGGKEYIYAINKRFQLLFLWFWLVLFCLWDVGIITSPLLSLLITSSHLPRNSTRISQKIQRNGKESKSLPNNFRPNTFHFLLFPTLSLSQSVWPLDPFITPTKISSKPTQINPGTHRFFPPLFQI